MALLDLSSSMGLREENGPAGPFLPMAFRYIGSRRTFLTCSDHGHEVQACATGHELQSDLR